MDKRLQLAISDCGQIAGLSAVLLLGEPGTGKTRAATLCAQEWGAEILFYQCHQGTGKEELLYDLDIRGVVERLAGGAPSASYITKGLLYQAVERSHQGRVVLVLDEIDKSRPSLDGFLLDFLQNGRLSDPYLGVAIANSRNLLVIATSNDERLLSEPLYRRFRRIRFHLPSPVEEIKILADMVGREVIERVGKEKVKFVVAIAAWQRKQEGVVKKVTTPELARLLRDLAYGDLSPSEKVEILLSWFSPHQEDQTMILEKFNKKYLERML